MFIEPSIVWKAKAPLGAESISVAHKWANRIHWPPVSINPKSGVKKNMRVESATHFSTLELIFTGYNESYLRGSFRCNAKRATQTRDHVRKQKPHALRRHLSAPSFLDSNWVQESGCHGCSFGPTKQPLQRR